MIEMLLNYDGRTVCCESRSGKLNSSWWIVLLIWWSTIMCY